MAIAGGGEEGHLAEVRRLVQERGLGADFEFLGPIEDDRKWSVYREADLFVLPSQSENFGIVIAEALACGVPALTTRGTPWQELALHGCGWWIDLGVEPLSLALREATSLPPSELREMGRRGRKLIEAKYHLGTGRPANGSGLSMAVGPSRTAGLCGANMKTFLDPVAWVWLGALALGLARLFWPATPGKVEGFTRFFAGRRRSAWVLLGFVLFTGLAQAFNVHARLVYELERPFLKSELEPEAADAVVVLGGNLSAFQGSYLGMEMSDSVDRVLTGIALIRAGKGQTLVLGGGQSVQNLPGEAQTTKAWLESWKLVTVPITGLGVCADTHDEALHTRLNWRERTAGNESCWSLPPTT